MILVHSFNGNPANPVPIAGKAIDSSLCCFPIICLIFLNWTTELMKHVTFALFNNTTAAQYVVMGFAGLVLILGVVLGVIGLKVKSDES